MIKKILMGLGVLFVVIIVIGIASGGSRQPSKVGDSGSQEAQQAPETERKTEFKVGDVIQLGERELTVNDVDRTKQLGEFQTAKSGKEYVVVNVTIKNVGDSQVTYNPLDFKLQDSNGAQESMTFAVLDDSLNSGELVAGGKVIGSIPFEAPAGDQGLKLIYQGNFWSQQDKIVVKL